METNQKNFKGVVLIIIILAITIVYYAFVKPEESPTYKNTDLELEFVEAGTYKVPVNKVASPDNTKIVYNIWDNVGLRMGIYISKTDGTEKRLLTKQEVGEGSGSMIPESLAWSPDGKYITYIESQLTCPEECRSSDDIIGMKVTHQVDISTGEKKILSKVPEE